MLKTHFTEEDFQVFHIDGLENRMEGIKLFVRPKLEEIGQYFAPTLTVLTGDEMFPHVAKHARRKVNPPSDTWVAFANHSRGYKMLPHFQVGLWSTHIFIWFAMIYEAKNKVQFGENLEKNKDKIIKNIPDNFVWSIDHMKPNATKHHALSEQDFTQMFHRLQTVKKAELLCGFHIPTEEAITMTPEELTTTIGQVFNTLIPLYQLAR